MTQKNPGIFCPLKHQEWVRACKELTPAERDAFYYIRIRDPYNSGIEISAAAIARDLSIPERTIHRQTISRALKVLAYISLIDEKYGRVRCSLTTERQIRARLHKKLGGLIELPTTVNRIDLLTDSELIQVKEVNNWKLAMGQALAYSGFRPEPKKRIHLFGKAKEQLATAEAICDELDIIITFEIVRGDE